MSEKKELESRLMRYRKGQFDVFLSHAWGQGKSIHEVVCSVGAMLQRVHDISCWFDRNEVKHGDIMRTIPEGIDRSSLGIVFVTREYMDKVNSNPIELPRDYCRSEFRYMVKKMSVARMIPVVVEEDMLDMKEWKNLFLAI